MSPNNYAAAACQSDDISLAATQCSMLVNQQLAETGPELIPDLLIIFVAGYSPEAFENACTADRRTYQRPQRDQRDLPITGRW